MNYNLDKSVGHNIATLAVLLKRQVFRLISENQLEITPDQWVIMYYLWVENELSIGELSKKSKKDFANVTRIVDKLVKLGYVEKQKDEIDNRITKVFILTKADNIKSKVENCWRESTEIALKGISNEEQQVLLGLLKRIEDNVVEKMK